MFDYLPIAKAINDYYKDFDINKSTINIILDISRIFKMGKVTSRVYNEKLGKYLTAYEYFLEGDKFNSGMYDEKVGKYIIDEEEDDFDSNREVLQEVHTEFVNAMTNKINNKTAQFLKLLKGENYLYTSDYKGIKDSLDLIEFTPDNENEIKEMYILIMDYNNYFGYIVFERNQDENLNDEALQFINSLCNVFGSNISKFDIKAKYQEDLEIKNTILNNENVPIFAVEKHTFRVLFANDLYRENFCNIRVGEVHQELLESEEKNPILEDLLISDVNQSKHQWIRKGHDFKFKNGTDAYMVYYKDNIDYINQINAVDNLTKALLLRGFEEYYDKFIVNSGEKYALCTLDVDKFKYINEMFGYKMGDKILINMVSLMSDFMETGENFCRKYEEKFALFLKYETEDQLNERIKELSYKFEEMKENNYKDVKITITGGVTFVDKNLPLNTLIDQAATARKSAKGTHKNSFSYYNPESDAKIKKEMQLEERIPYAIANDEFVPFLQPKFDLKTQTICGAEALVRWVTEEGMIYPDQFIPLFEKNGFIITLDFIIYNKIMAYIRHCLDNGLPVYPISVNVSRNHTKDKNFMDKFKALIEKYKIPLKYLELEITESVFVEDKNELINFVDEIKDYALKVSIDDFGTAYSSLQNLTEIDIDVLKIDKGFLDNIDTSTNSVTKDEILIKNIINLAKDLDFNVICEGVETKEQIEVLKNIGCEYGQGYVFARPMPIEDYEKQFLQSDKKNN